MNVNHLIKEPQIIEKKNNPDLLMVCPGFELHIGKLATVAILRIIQHFMLYGDLSCWKYVNTRKEWSWDLIIRPGNDFFNADTSDDKTTAGTEQK